MNTFDGFRIDAFDVPSDPSDATIHEIPVGETLEDIGAIDLRDRRSARDDAIDRISRGMRRTIRRVFR